MRVLITGMGGELGTRVANLLEADPAVTELVGIDGYPPRRRITRVRFHRIEPEDRRRTVEIVRAFDPEVIVHLGVYEPHAHLGGTAARLATQAAAVSTLGAATSCPSLRRIVVRSGIEFDNLGRRVAYHLYRSHPEDGPYLSPIAPMSGQGGMDTVRIDAKEIIHLFRVLRPGQIRGEPWLSRALVKLNELDQYDDAELVRKKTAAMFAGFVTRANPEDNLMGEGAADADGIALAGLEPGTLQILEPGEDIKFSDPADVGGSYSEFLRTQFRAVAAAIGITYEQLTGDLTGVNYSSIRAGMLEFRRRCEMVQHGVLVHQLCRPVWAAWMKQAVLAGALDAPGFARGGPARRRQYLAVKWIPQGWQWVDPEKEFKAMLLAIRAGLMSRSEAISANGYDAEDVDREIAADNQRADDLGLIFDSDPRYTSKDGGSAEPNRSANAPDTTGGP